MSKSELQCAAEALADSFLAGEFAAIPMTERGLRHFIKMWKGLGKLAVGLEEKFGVSSRPARRDLVKAIMDDKPFRRWLERGSDRFDFEFRHSPKMWAAGGEPSRWELPEITTPVELARWLNLNEQELEWFARPWRGNPERLQHYRYHWIEKRRGGHRLIEKPKDALKLIQSELLHRILDLIPPHDAVHSYRAGRGVISYAAPHCDQPLLLRLDIADFFPTLQAGRVRALFRTAGYPDAVASLLADLCCAKTPAPILTDAPSELSWDQAKSLGSPHLPQGAPTSPALSNLLGFRLDCRLAGLARSIGASYTRYADDLAFSGDRRIAGIAPMVAGILIEEGFSPNHRKTRLLRRATRQRLGGTIVNSGSPNIERQDFDRLKATLHNCARLGVSSQDREQLGTEKFRCQLLGRIAWVHSLNPGRGEKLRAIFDRIDWAA